MILSCSNDSDTPKAQVTKKQLIKSGWLQNNLPTNALAYVRLPNPWFFFSGQDNGFAYAQSNEGHNQQIQAIRDAFFSRFVDASHIPNKEALNLLLKHTNAPIELAVLQERPGQIMPVLVLATQFDYASQAEFSEQFQQILNGLPMIQELSAINQAGQGELSIQGGSVHYRFDESNGHFRLMFGMFDMSTLKAVAEQLKPGQPDSMQELQERVDTSGQGLFAWVNGKDLMPMAEMMLSPYEMQPFKEMGFEQLNALALGYGTANNKSRLRLAMDMPYVGVRQFLPKVENKISVKTVGEPSAFGMVSIPSYAQLEQIITRAEEANAEEILAELEAETTEVLGIGFKDLMSIFGPELTVYKDRVGTFSSVRLNDKAGLQSLIKKLKDSGHGDYQIRKYNGQDIHHLSFQLANDNNLPELPNASASEFFAILMQMSSHLFWLEEDGHMIFASIPQPLMERLDKGAKVDLATWIAKNQGQNIDNALFAASGTFDDLSRSAYHTYIELLLLASELVDSKMDVMAFPSANKLAFANEGTLGLQIDSTDNLFAMELTFEQGPLDLLHAAGSMQVFAVGGILAAVAIPAYQDYVDRSKAYQRDIEALREMREQPRVYPEQFDDSVIEIESEVIESVEEEIEETIIDDQ